MNGFMSTLDFGCRLAANGLEYALVGTAGAALLAIVVLAINVLGRRWISAGQMGLLWGLVLLRLLVPYGPASAVSLQNLVWPRPGEAADAQPAAMFVLVGAARPSDATASSPSALGTAAAETSLFETLAGLLPLVWLGAAIAGLGWTLAAYWRFCRRVNRVAVCRDERLLALRDACCRQAQVQRVIPIRVCEVVRQPAVMGLLRPRLLLPTSATSLGDEQLRLILLHELAHVRRYDIALNWALVVLRAAYWWNPVYWLAASRFCSLREQACDAFVIRRAGQPTRTYSELLLSFAAREAGRSGWRVTLPASILGFFPGLGRRAVRNRLRALPLAGLRQNRWHAVAVATLIALVAVCGLTDAKPPRPDDATDWLPQATFDGQTWRVAGAPEEGPRVTRTYNISRPLARLAAEMEIDDARAADVLKMHLASVVRTSQPLRAAADPSQPAGHLEVAEPALSIEGTRLIFSASEARHRELARYLQACKAGGFEQISVECRFLRVPPEFAERLGVDWQYMETAADPADELFTPPDVDTPVVRAATTIDGFFMVGLATLSEREVQQLGEAGARNRRVSILQAPKVTLFSGQKASIHDVTQRAFVIGMRQVAGGGQEPKITVVDEGLKITLRATAAGESRVRLNARIAVSQLGDVRRVSTVLAGKTIQVEVPQVKRCRIDVASEVEDKQSLLIGCVPAYDKEQLFYVLLTPRRIAE